MTNLIWSRSYSRFQLALIFISVTSLYFLVGWSSLKLATINDFSSPIWSASGLAVGCLLLFGNWLAPAIFLGAFLTNLTVNHDWINLFSIATGNMMEALVGSLLIGWLIRRNTFRGYTEFVTIAVVSVLASLVSASFGASTLLLRQLIDSQDFTYVWYTWWSGDVVGMLIILPLFLEIFIAEKLSWKLPLRKVLVLIGFLGVFLLTSILVFMKGFNQAFSWILCPFFIMSGIYLGRFYSRVILILVAYLIVVMTALGYGPFEFGDLNLDLIYVQCLLASYTFSVLFVRPLLSGFKTGIAYILYNVVGWSSIFVVIFLTSRVEKRHMMEDLQNSVQQGIETILDATHHYERLLHGGVALFLLKPEINSQEWNTFVTTLDLESNFSGINGFGFIRPIKKDQEKSLKIKIKEFDAAYSARFDDRYVVTLVDPLGRNISAQGLDIGSEEKRRTAADKSRNLNIPVATDEIHLIQDQKKRPAFLLFYPFWKSKDEFVGWFYAPVLSEVFFNRAFSQLSSLLHLKITRNDQVIYQNGDFNKSSIQKKYLRQMKTTIFGSDALLEFYPTSEFFKRHSNSTAPLALLLSLFMLSIAGFLLEQLTFGQRAEDLVKKRTSELEDSKMQLINSSKMASLGEMASGMAHEINNPITIIQGKIKVINHMLEDLNVNYPPLNAEIQRIDQTTERIGRIVKGLKTFSRSAQDDPFELVPLETIIKETLDLCAERLKANGITLTIEPVPQICVLCRASQLSQVLMNLLNNSSDALIDLKVKFISLAFEVKEPDKVFIYVTDSGQGIPLEIASKIMDPFFTTKGVGKGTGLGLSIAKGIIEAHGGTLHLDAKSTNTRFVIELPLQPL